LAIDDYESENLKPDEPVKEDPRGYGDDESKVLSREGRDLP
jgi:hypothetical protein